MKPVIDYHVKKSCLTKNTVVYKDQKFDGKP